MPPPLPPRYRLEVRLGRDEDVEEWLATDTALDRPVLIRVLGPESDPARRKEFLAAVRQASAVAHTHVASVFEAGELTDGAYSISEWAGGVSMAHRLRANETVAPTEFLPNAAGLAEGLAELHRQGTLHGSIDPGAILFSAAHPAKLAAFGRPARARTAAEDVRDLGTALEVSLTGRPPDGVPPSQVVDGLPGEVDRVLDLARRGMISAAELAEALHGAPSVWIPPDRKPVATTRWLVLTVMLVVLAGLIVALGRAFDIGGPLAPVLFPATPRPSTPDTVVQETIADPTPTTAAPSVEGVEVVAASAFDPFGDDQEHERELPNLIDGDLGTTWSTERYQSPLRRLKPGVGLAFPVRGSPSELEVLGVLEGTSYDIFWAAAPEPDLEAWERISSGVTQGGRIATQLPSRSDGTWLLWFTDLPLQAEGAYLTSVAEVRFRP